MVIEASVKPSLKKTLFRSQILTQNYRAHNPGERSTISVTGMQIMESGFSLLSNTPNDIIMWVFLHSQTNIFAYSWTLHNWSWAVSLLHRGRGVVMLRWKLHWALSLNWLQAGLSPSERCSHMTLRNSCSGTGRSGDVLCSAAGVWEETLGVTACITHGVDRMGLENVSYFLDS